MDHCLRLCCVRKTANSSLNVTNAENCYGAGYGSGNGIYDEWDRIEHFTQRELLLKHCRYLGRTDR